jgi:hypothetical protein
MATVRYEHNAWRDANCVSTHCPEQTPVTALRTAVSTHCPEQTPVTALRTAVSTLFSEHAALFVFRHTFHT